MKQTKYRFILTALAAVVLLATGCSKAPQVEDFGDDTYLSLSIDGVKTATSAQSTRATAVDESAVSDLWVLQFQMTAGTTVTGTLVAKSYIATVTNLAQIKFLPIEGDNMALYLVANSGNSSLFSSTADGTTLAAVKETAVTITSTAGNNFPTETSASLPMVGQSATLKLPTTTAVPVTLTRAAAKVVLTIKNPLAVGYPQLTVTGTQLKNVPLAYSTQVVNDAMTYYPTASAANFKDYTSTTGNITAAGTTTTYYLAPNVRGISTNTNDRLKSDLTAPSGQGDFCTYVEILGTAKASSTAPAVDVRYRLYLGGNNTNDYNLYANTAYAVDIELAGINGNDARMTITTDKFDLIQGSSEGDHTGDVGDGWNPIMVGAFRNGGIVYWIDVANPMKYKVLSLDQSNLLWSAKKTYVLDAAGQSSTDGKSNVAAMKAYSLANTGNSDANKKTTGVFATDFPAAEFCDKKNTGGVTGWYLPAKDELEALSDAYTIAANKTAIDAGLAGNSGTAITASGDFWSSTEGSFNTSAAWFVNFELHLMNSTGKNYNNYVRCVRNITPPPPPAVGDYYFTDGSFSSKLESGKTVNGVIYYVDAADPTNYKVVSLEETEKTWAATNTYVVSGARSDADGKANSAAIKAAFDARMAGVAITESTFDAAFPAAAYCYNYKGKAGTDALGSWYLPAKSELQYLWCAYNGVAPISWATGTNNAAAPADAAKQTLWNDRITAGGGAKGIASGGFWSSTEYSVYTSIAWSVYFSNGDTNISDKSYDTYVRCVRDL